MARQAAALFLPPGAGKTSTVYGATKVLRKMGRVHGTLVIGPLRVCYQVWPAEAQKWRDFADLKVHVLHGNGKDRDFDEDADFYVINPEGLPWLLRTDVWRWFKRKVNHLVIDELTKFKNMRGMRYKMLKPHLPHFDYRWGLTGSPAAKGLLDLFGQVYALDLGATFGPYITHYRSRYFEPSGYLGYDWVLRKGAEKLIYEKLKPVALRIDESKLDLPKRVDNIIEVKLPPAARKAYDDMEQDFFVAMEEGNITAVNAAVASGKCLQMANGGVYFERQRNGVKFRDVQFLHDAKTDALEELIEELNGSPLLVAYMYEHDLERIRKIIGKNAPYVGGGVSPRESNRIEDAWNAGEIAVLPAHPQSVAHGLNLQGAAQHVCWYSITPNFELYDQFIRRVLRQGNKAKRVYVHHIIAKDTVDQPFLMTLRKRERNQNALFDALKSYAVKRKK